MRVGGWLCRLAGIVSTLSISFALLGCAGAGDPLNVDFKAEKNPPRGYLVYCSREPARCGDTGNALVWLTKTRWDELVKVNDTVNMKNVAETDEDGFGLVDYWTVAEGAGDCEDLALAKREALVTLGWPKSALLLAVADTSSVDERGAPAGPQRHVVLLAFTDQGTYVLDNLTRQIIDWTKANYHWTAVESAGNPLAWQAVKRGGR